MNNKMMDALVKTVAGPGLVLKRVPVPIPKANEVLIRVRKAAICGSDVHIYNWDEWSQRNVRVGVVVGHEFVGQIVAVGDDVSFCKVGQRVSGESHVFCNHCIDCRAGHVNWCPNTEIIGIQRDGAFAEYICLPEDNVIVIDDDSIPDEVVAFFDAYGNATYTARTFELTGANVLITGAGPIGAMAAAIAKYSGARRVVITDFSEYRLNLAHQLGADRTVNLSQEELENVMLEQGIENGFDVGLEMSGSPAALGQLIDSMCNGGKVSLLGIGNDLQLDGSKIISKGITVQGITGRQLNTWHQMVCMIQGGLNLHPLVTHRLNYQDFEKGFAAMSSGKSGKVIFTFWEE